MVGLEIAIVVLLGAIVCLLTFMLISHDKEVNAIKRSLKTFCHKYHNNKLNQSDITKENADSDKPKTEPKYKTPYDLADAILDGSEDIDDIIKEKE